MNLPQLGSEKKREYEARTFEPRFLGMVHLENQTDAVAIDMLREPDELVLAVPLGGDYQSNLVVGKLYGIFALKNFFDPKRDDETPLERNGIRDAQRKLFSLLVAHQGNSGFVVTKPSLPSTVRLRETQVADHAQYFDLSNLVRDCNVDLDLPQEPTPKLLQNVELRDYQKSSLRWLLDKERQDEGMGTAGELWHRLRFLDSGEDYYYCELTGSFSLDIYDFAKDSGQKNASEIHFSPPTGGVLGEEMGYVSCAGHFLSVLSP